MALREVGGGLGEDGGGLDNAECSLGWEERMRMGA